MGDVSTEPSMEDILSSIKRIIAEEGEGAVQGRPRRGDLAAPPRAAGAAANPPASEDEVLELSDPIPAPEPAMTTPVATDRPAPAAILSDATASATRGALDILSRLVVKPEPPSDGTLEGLVRDLLRPMLREWIDANLPAMVEQMVQREIGKITGAPR